jgi:tetratricopeptide (TPR) repeat protein
MILCIILSSQLKDYKNALSFAEKAESYLKEYEPAKLSLLYFQMTICLCELTEYQEAVKAATKCFSMRRALFGENSHEAVLGILAVSYVLKVSGELDNAVEHYMFAERVLRGLKYRPVEQEKEKLFS